MMTHASQEGVHLNLPTLIRQTAREGGGDNLGLGINLDLVKVSVAVEVGDPSRERQVAASEHDEQGDGTSKDPKATATTGCTLGSRCPRTTHTLGSFSDSSAVNLNIGGVCAGAREVGNGVGGHGSPFVRWAVGAPTATVKMTIGCQYYETTSRS